MFAGQSEIRQLLFERVEEGHAACDVKGKSNGLCGVDYQSGALMKDRIERSVDHVLVDDD